jgi:hypothetical protein
MYCVYIFITNDMTKKCLFILIKTNAKQILMLSMNDSKFKDKKFERFYCSSVIVTK